MNTSEQSVPAHDRLSAVLKSSAQALCSDPFEGAPLRRIQRLARDLLFSRDDAYIRAVAFMLDEWIKDYYLNFAGDIFSPAEKNLERLCEALLRQQVSKALDMLSDAVATGNEGETMRCFQLLVVSYLDVIKESHDYVGQW